MCVCCPTSGLRVTIVMEVCRRCKTTVCSKEVNDEVGCLVCLRRFFGRICYEKHLVVKQCREVRL